MTSEHAYQAAKFDDADVVNLILIARSAHEALKLAQKYSKHIRPTWSDEKLLIMEDIIRAKLAQHPYIEKQLRQSAGLELVEDAEKDSFWGRGPDWKGNNHLGKLWMNPRSYLHNRCNSRTLVCAAIFI